MSDAVIIYGDVGWRLSHVRSVPQGVGADWNNETMPDKYDLSRRKVLAGLGTIGIAGAGAGLGTSAYFSDTESLNNNQLTAGELNLVVDWATAVDQGSAGSSSNGSIGDKGGEPIDGNPGVYSYVVEDIKPGDSGTVAFCPKVIDNPAWLWIGSEGITDNDNGLTEPESDVDSTGGDGEGELSENVYVTSVQYANKVSFDGDQIVCSDGRELGYTYEDEEGEPLLSLADLASELENGSLIDPDYTDEEPTPYPASPDAETQNGPCVCVHWEVPTDVGNEIQTDSLAMDFSLTAMQYRHNPNGGNETNNPYNGTQD